MRYIWAPVTARIKPVISFFVTMKALKVFGIGFLALVAVLMIASVFIPSQVHIERSVVMEAPKEVIFQQVNTLPNWPKWSPWLSDTSELTLTYEGAQAGEGSSFTWLGRIPGSHSGTLTITRSVPFERLELKVDYNKGKSANLFYKFEEIPDGVRVTTGLTTDVGKAPFEKYRSLTLDNRIGPLLKEGLDHLKDLVEE